MKSHPFPSVLAGLAASLTVLTVAARAWQTYPDDQDPSSPFFVGGPFYSWVNYDCRYSQPGQTLYKGVWREPNAWPEAGASVILRHKVNLNNNPYYPSACDPPSNPPTPPPPVYPFGTTGGNLTINSLNIEPGGLLISSLKTFRFDGGSTWNGAYVAVNSSNQFSGLGLMHNQGDLVIASPSTIGRGGQFLNTNRISIPSSLGLEFGLESLTNQSGTAPDPFYAEIALTQPGASIVQANGGGGFSGYITNNGVLRKQGPGTSTISGIVIYNHADSPANRAGTIQVDSGTLVNSASRTEYYGLKAEIAPGAVLQLSGDHRMHPGTTTVTGGGVLRLAADCVLTDPAQTGTATLAALEGKLECAGADLRDLVNTGRINVTAPSIWSGIVNKGHVRQWAGLQLGSPSSNGTASDSSAVWDLEDTAGFAPVNQGPTFHNYALLRKSGPGTSVISLTTLIVHGSATDPNAGRIEVTGGVLHLPAQVHFINGGTIRVANGTAVQIAERLYFDTDGTLTLTGSGKVQLVPGSTFYTGNATATGTLKAAPGTFDLTGGQVNGPLNNLGEITVTAPTGWGYGYLGSNTITNSGTMRFLASSAGASNSMTLGALVGMDCTPTSVLAFDIAGRPNQNGQWARLRFGGQNYFNAGGTLRVNFGEFTPVSGDRWRVIDYQSGVNPATGDFAVEFANVPAGFVPVYEKVGSGSNLGYQVGLDAVATPVTFPTWAAAQNFPTPAAAGYDVDADGDGFSNGVECALGTNPQSVASRPDMTAARTDSGGDLFLSAHIKRPGGALRPTDLQFIAERTDTLGSWTTSGVILEVGPLDAEGNETLFVRTTEPIDFHPRAFIRLRIEKLP